MNIILETLKKSNHTLEQFTLLLDDDVGENIKNQLNALLKRNGISNERYEIQDYVMEQREKDFKAETKTFLLCYSKIAEDMKVTLPKSIMSQILRLGPSEMKDIGHGKRVNKYYKEKFPYYIEEFDGFSNAREEVVMHKVLGEKCKNLSLKGIQQLSKKTKNNGAGLNL